MLNYQRVSLSPSWSISFQEKPLHRFVGGQSFEPKSLTMAHAASVDPATYNFAHIAGRKI
jgi:hypothetical protein